MEAGALPRPARAVTPRSRRLLAAFSDERLVEHIRRGNETAFEVVYDRHSRGILSFCRHMLGTADEAEDAVQHTFIAAYGDLVASDRPIKLKAWLYTIARNRCLSMLRARRERAVEEVEVSTAGLAEQVQERQDVRELLADMRELPDEQRAALVLAELGDLSHADIGQVLGVEAVKVKSLVFQARSTLIENRDARAIPCGEIREQLSTLRGGALRRGPLRKHVKACDGCRQFRDEVRRQRAMMGLVLPVVPSLGLKNSALAAIGGGSAAAAGGAAAGAAGGGIFSGLGSASIVAKTVVAVAVGGAAVGGGVAIEKGALSTSSPPSSPPSSVEQGTTHRSAVADGVAQGPPGSTAATLPGVRAGSTPNGVARRVRAHGSPATKHHANSHAGALHTVTGPAVTTRGHRNDTTTTTRGQSSTHRSTSSHKTTSGGKSTGTESTRGSRSGSSGQHTTGTSTTSTDGTTTTTTTPTGGRNVQLPVPRPHANSVQVTPTAPAAP
jgi:RNA polymerase sigma factor (sigma-70 family)